MKNLRNIFILFSRIISLVSLLFVTNIAFAKSLYVIANINSSPTPIHTYDIQGAPNHVVFQAEQTITYRGGGGVGIAVDSDTAKLFVTYEVSNVIQLLDATDFSDLGTTTAPGASNLSGIVVDQTKSRVYTIDRNTNNLYVYDWDATTNTLTLVTGGTGTGGSFPLAGVSFAYGIAFDEVNDKLYVADRNSNTVRYFETSTFTESGNIVLTTHMPISIAVDQVRNFLYTGAIFNNDVNLVKYDLNTDTETFVDINTLDASLNNDGVIGVAVDEDTGNVYATTGFSYDGFLVFDSALNNLKILSRSDIIGFDTNWGDATGIAIPRADISFNPLSFTKTVDLAEASAGFDLTYSLCYDNAANTQPVNNVTITDAVPVGVSFVSASNGGIETSGVVTWPIGILAAGASQACVQMVVSVTAPVDSVITNTATIDSDDTPPTTQTVVTTVIEQPELTFSALANVSTIPSGENLTYDLCYENVETDSDPASATVTDTLPSVTAITDANNATITDTVPTGTTFVSASDGGTEASGIVSWDIGTIVANSPQACVQMVVNVTALPGSVITNTATIDSDETASTTVTDTTDVGPPLAVNYNFKGKGGGSATGPVELFMLAFGMGFLLLTRRKKGIAKRISALSVVFVLGSIMASSPVVYADTYLGASAGTASADYNSSDLVNALPSYTVQNVSIDDSDTGWKVFGGYEFTPNLAIEAAYVDLGEITTEFSATIAPDDLAQFASDAAAIHPYMASGFALTGVGKFDITQTVVVFGKIGLFNWDAEGNVKETGSGQLVKLDDSGTNLVYGLGISYEVSPQFGIRAEWESYDVDWDKINLFSVGVEYRF